KELTNLRILFYIKSIAIAIGQLTTRLALYVCVIAYIGFGNHITAEQAFVVAGTLSALRAALHIFLPMGIAHIAELKASLQRITNFLEMEEVPENSNVDHTEKKQPRVRIENAVVKSDTGDNILENINLEIKPGLTTLTGPVGAGKSTLLKLMLSDVKSDQGTVKISGKMSYASQEPWLFPGSVRQNIIFGEVFDEQRYKTVVKVCALKKDIDAFPEGDKTFLTDKGLNLSGGQKARINLARAIYKIADVYLLDNCLSAVDTHVGKHIFQECIKGFLKDNICILVTHHDYFLQAANDIILLDKGIIKFRGSYGILKEKYNQEFVTTIKNYKNTENYAKAEEIEEKIGNHVDDTEETSKLLLARIPTKKHIYEETEEEGTVKKEVYFKYFTSGGGIKMLFLMMVLSIIAQVAVSWSDYFVSFWVDTEQDLSGFRYNHTTDSPEYKLLEESHSSLMKLYSFVILAAGIFTVLKTFAFFTFATLASRNVHKLMLEKVLNAAMIFFDTHLSGNILNRFSRDLGILDEKMPYTVYEVAMTIITILATVSVVSSVSLFFIIPSAIYILVLVLARQLYIPTGRSIKRLEGATRSPVIGHLNATLEGLTTIRASKVQAILKSEFDRHQDHYNSVSYMHSATTRAFGFYLDTLSSFYITVITLTFLFIKTETLAGQVGLAITQSFSLSGLLRWGVRHWADLENEMTSCERVLEYCKIESEDKSGYKLTNWPNSGKIVYADVNLRYSSTSKGVLKDVSFTVLPKQKIGIVGRTGAGKSSVVSTLFRMYEFKGSICVDDVDINTVAVESLRSKISIIPQDPVLFLGTVRSNLDPNHEYSDEELWEALEVVEIKRLVGSLNDSISEGGANFSIGQRQLLCLARAIIRNNVILILDEATANVDPQTDSLIQRTIKNRFSDCTVITVAHKLHTIMDSDNVLVMDSGVGVEYDHPTALLEKKGLFYNMVKEAGEELRNLRIIFYIKTLAISIGRLSSRVALYICVMSYVALGNHITAEKAFVVTGCFGILRYVLTGYIPAGIAQLAELRASLHRITSFLLLEEVPQNQNVEYIETKQPKVYIKDAVVKSDKGVNVLENINLELEPGLTILTGSVGAGKSTLFKLMLSDIKKDGGTVEIFGKMSYASQEPWLFPGTVRQNIIFGERFDETRYETVVKVCALKKDFDTFPYGDKTYLTDKGLNLSRGQKTRINLARAVYKVADIYLLDDCFSAVDNHVGKHIFHECIKKFLQNKICILVTHHSQFFREADNIVLLDKGIIEYQGKYAHVEEKHMQKFMIVIDSYEDIKEGYKKVEEIEETIANNIENANETSKLLLAAAPTKKHIYEESTAEGAVKKEVYFKYLISGGGIKMLILLVILSISAQAMSSWSDYFISFWVDMEQELSGFRHNQTTNSTEYKELEKSHDSVMKQYSFVILGAVVLSLLNSFAFFTFAIKASKNIHNLILKRILNAAMMFFDTHLSGNILNRFSRDLGILDESMPYTVLDISGIILSLLGTLSVVSSVNLFFLIPSTFYIIILLIARRLYIPTGRSIRRLEGATRSPVIGHLNATLEGLTTIRASRTEQILRKEFDRHQDLYNSVAYMNLATTRAFGFYLDAFSSFYMVIITLTFLFIKTETLAGQVGLAITQSFSLTGLLQWAVRQWAEFENEMTSTERVLEYSKIESEEKSGDRLNSWPSSGRIVYTDVSLRYSSTSEKVLKNVSFEVLPKQKIGIVGRTGAGKTSVVSTLFRMYEYRGNICIDDVDINSIAVELLRSKISIIPQDPVLFSGTIRSNLDPYNKHSDKELWDALEEVEMKRLVDSLNCSISDGGVNFSIGQRQLVCLARAIISHNVILILDEATANVDPQTDSLIQRTIKRKFSDCTVITIAHKLHTIMDSDNVLVMDSGVGVEYDHPKVLLEKKGLFYNMVREAGLL
ncbi:hypothetical protein ILUMI_24868, partial [Ignelater luminosus]